MKPTRNGSFGSMILTLTLLCFCTPTSTHAGGKVAAWGDNTFGQTRLPNGLNNIKAVAAGDAHTLALRADGTVVAWGADNHGQSRAPDSLRNVAAIAAGGEFSLALKSDGTVTAWGYGYYGQTNVPTGLANVIAVAAGGNRALALKADGTVIGWGLDNTGRLAVPPGLSNVVAIAGGGSHSLALKADGRVAAWGYNSYGQTNVSPGLSNVVAIAAGGWHSLALKADGTVVAWGAGTNHGNYPHLGQSLVPAGLSNIVGIAAGATHSLALKADGTVAAWGATNSWQSGAPPQGLTNVLAVAAGSAHSLAIVFEGPPEIVHESGILDVPYTSNAVLTVIATGREPLGYQWHWNGTAVTNFTRFSGATTATLTISNAQFGDAGIYTVVVSNAFGSVSSAGAALYVIIPPVTPGAPYIRTQPASQSVPFGHVVAFSVNAVGSAPLNYQWRHEGQDIPGATNATLTLTAVRYDQASFYTVAVSNAFGSMVSAKAYLAVTQGAVWGGAGVNVPTNIPPGLTNLVALSAGYSHILGLKADGTVASWAWDSPWTGASPPPALTNIPPGLTNVSAIAAGGSHNLALKSDGTVVAWGDNSYGQTNVPAGLSNVVAIAGGGSDSLALRADGEIIAWGGNPFMPGYPWPEYPFPAWRSVSTGLSNAISIATDAYSWLVLKADGTVVAWTWSWPYLTNAPTGMSNIVAITGGGDFSLLLGANGSVGEWYAGPIGIIARPPLPRLSNAVAIAAGSFGMALKADGGVVVWGSSPGIQAPQALSNIIAIAAGGGFFAAVVGDGSPFLKVQPVGQTVSRGATVQFHARAVGVQPMRYQWQLNGGNLPGATNADLTVTNVQGNDTGGYRAVVANALGTDISATAQLTIPFSANLAAALNATNLVWTASGTNAPWFAQIQETHDGNAAAQSGHVAHNQQSALQTTVTGPGTLTFWWKVSSEEGYDRLWFSMDFLNWAAWISGETDWRQFTYHVPPGSHVLRWAYTKDSTVSAGQDAGWLDEVAFTPTPTNQPSSIRFIGQPIRQPDGTIELTVNSGQPSEDVARCEVQVSTNLVNWDSLPGALTLTNGAICIRDTAASNNPVRFYRVVEH